MRHLILAVVFTTLLTLAGCGEDIHPGGGALIRDGQYEGTYTMVVWFGAASETSRTCGTSLTLHDGTYTLDERNYICPPGGYGTYELTPTTISFRDTAPHTTEFDPSLIMSGAYNYWFDGVNLYLTQTDTVQTFRREIRRYSYALALSE